jgi:hypothetical protein
MMRYKEKSALLGWDDEDYDRVNKKLKDYGHKYQNIMHKHKRKDYRDYIYYKDRPKYSYSKGRVKRNDNDDKRKEGNLY